MKTHFLKLVVIKLLLIVVTMMFLQSCAAHFPQAIDIPLIKERGDMRMNAGVFLVPAFTESPEPEAIIGTHIAFTTGITDILAAQVYMSSDVLFRAYIHAALGLYNRFANNTVVEFYGGFGHGTTGAFSTENYSLPFVQLNFGKNNFEHGLIDYGFGLRAGYLLVNNSGSSSNNIFRGNGWQFEPTVFARLGRGRVKFSTKVTYLWTNVVAKGDYYPLNMSFGVSINLGRTPTTVENAILY